MHALFDPKMCVLIFCITPGEARATAILLQRVWIEQQKKNQRVPRFPEVFFEDLASSEKMVYLKCEFGYLEFIVAFIEAIAQAQRDEGIDDRNLGKLLEMLRPFRTEGMTAN